MTAQDRIRKLEEQLIVARDLLQAALEPVHFAAECSAEDNSDQMLLDEILRYLGETKRDGETARARFSELETALRNLTYPNVPSADDFRLLIIATGGSNEKNIDSAMELADKLEAAQNTARKLLGKGGMS